MNQDSNVETLYLNTLNPKCFVRVNGLSTNPKILRSPAKRPACVVSWKWQMQVAFALFYHRFRLFTSSRVFLVPLERKVVKAVIFYVAHNGFKETEMACKTYKGDNFGLDLED